MIQHDGLNAEGYCRTCHSPLDIAGNCAQCDLENMILEDQTPKQIDAMIKNQSRDA